MRTSTSQRGRHPPIGHPGARATATLLEPGGVVSNTRGTRFNSTRNPPEALGKILSLLDTSQLRRSRGCFILPEIRSIVQNSYRVHQPRGEADDVQRYLRNEFILLESEEGFYFDKERADLVEQCVREGKEPVKLSEAGFHARLAVLKHEVSEEKRKARERPSLVPTEPRPPAITPPPTPSTSNLDVEPVAPVPEALTAPVPPAPVPYTYAAYMLPAECDLLAFICVNVREPTPGSLRVGIYNDPERLTLDCAPKHGVADANDYLAALQRFVDFRLLEPVLVRERPTDRSVYHVMMDPHAILMIPIEKPREEIDDEELAVMRSLGRLSSEDLSRCVARGELDTWIDERWPNHAAHHDLIRFMLFTEPSFTARDARDEKRWLPTLRGFERIDISLRGRRLTIPPPEARPVPSIPAPELMPTEPAVAPTDTEPPEPIPCDPPPPEPTPDLAPEIAEAAPTSLEEEIVAEETVEPTPSPLPPTEVVLETESRSVVVAEEAPPPLEVVAPRSKPLSLEEQADELEREASRLDAEVTRLTAEAAAHRAQATALREQFKTSKVALAQEKLRRAQAELQSALADFTLDP